LFSAFWRSTRPLNFVDEALKRLERVSPESIHGGRDCRGGTG
jgi:hypothetical protein